MRRLVALRLAASLAAAFPPLVSCTITPASGSFSCRDGNGCPPRQTCGADFVCHTVSSVLPEPDAAVANSDSGPASQDAATSGAGGGSAASGGGRRPGSAAGAGADQPELAGVGAAGTSGGGAGTSMGRMTCKGEPPTRPCGDKCGMQSSTCNTDTGEWMFLATCNGEGACTPMTARKCEENVEGAQICGSDCQWGECLTPCGNSRTRDCGNCKTGTQTGTCNPATGLVTWGECVGGGACAEGSVRLCESEFGMGQQTCSETCMWSDKCVLTCNEPTTRSCGNCGQGTETGSCDPNTGRVVWSGQCDGGGECNTDDGEVCTAANGKQGTHVCDASCAWPSSCDLTCTFTAGAGGVPTQDCGKCGTQSGSCDPVSGEVRWNDCTGEGECVADEVVDCENQFEGSMFAGTKRCSGTCGWGPCVVCSGDLCLVCDQGGACMICSLDGSQCGPIG